MHWARIRAYPCTYPGVELQAMPVIREGLVGTRERFLSASSPARTPAHAPAHASSALVRLFSELCSPLVSQASSVAAQRHTNHFFKDNFFIILNTGMRIGCITINYYIHFHRTS